MKQEVKNADEMRKAAQEILASLQDSPRDSALIFALSGELGAGKTTFAQGLAEALGVEEPVVSPTFTIMRMYHIPKSDSPRRVRLQDNPFARLVHIDAYRLGSAEELLRLGWEELARDTENCIALEWPERVEGLPLEQAKRIALTLVTNTVHEINYHKN